MMALTRFVLWLFVLRVVESDLDASGTKPRSQRESRKSSLSAVISRKVVGEIKF